MNTSLFNKHLRTLKVALIFIGIAVTQQSCATKYAFTISPVVPSAEGWVKVSRDHNNNYSIDLSVKRLADPRRLTPPQEAYTVWMNTEHDGTKNVGQLKTNETLFSSMLESSLKTVTPFKPTGFFITAGRDNASEQQGNVVVLKTDK